MLNNRKKGLIDSICKKIVEYKNVTINLYVSEIELKPTPQIKLTLEFVYDLKDNHETLFKVYSYIELKLKADYDFWEELIEDVMIMTLLVLFILVVVGIATSGGTGVVFIEEAQPIVNKIIDIAPYLMEKSLKAIEKIPA